MGVNKENEPNLLLFRQLLEERIERIKTELSNARAELAKIDGRVGESGKISGQGRVKSQKTKRAEEVLLAVIGASPMRIREIVEAVQKVDSTINEAIIRRTLSRLGKIGALENTDRGMWRKKEKWTVIPGVL